MKKLFLATALIAATVAGCSGSSPSRHDPTAAQIARTVATHFPAVTSVKVWTATNDPNHLLGRPNGYSSVAALMAPGVPDWVAKVEVWPSANDAKARASYIETLQKGAPILGSEYDYTDGAALLRVSGALPPAMARRYDAAFRAAA